MFLSQNTVLCHLWSYAALWHVSKSRQTWDVFSTSQQFIALGEHFICLQWFNPATQYVQPSGCYRTRQQDDHEKWWHQRQAKNKQIIFVSDFYSAHWRQCVENKERRVQKEKRRKKPNVHSPQRAGCKSCSNTKHYVCAFVTQRAVIPRATNRKYPSERMKLEAVSHGCCGRIRWCRLAYLSQKAASAVQKTRWLVSPVCCESRDEWEHSGASHTESLSGSQQFQSLTFFPPCRFLVFVSHENVILRPPKKSGGVRVTQCVRRASLFGWKGQWVVDINSSSLNHTVATAFNGSLVSLECFYYQYKY